MDDDLEKKPCDVQLRGDDVPVNAHEPESKKAKQDFNWIPQLALHNVLRNLTYMNVWRIWNRRMSWSSTWPWDALSIDNRNGSVEAQLPSCLAWISTS